MQDPASMPSRRLGPEFCLDVQTSQGFAALHPYDQFLALKAQVVLNLAQRSGLIDLSRVRRVVDFGAGHGGPTYTLRTLKEKTGGRVDAVERIDMLAQRMVKWSILPPENVHNTDGLAFLHTFAREGRKLDLITAFMLNSDEMTTRELIVVAQQALDTEGRLLITSDIGTIATARLSFAQDGVDHEYTEAVTSNGRVVTPIVVASFSS